MVLTTIAVLVDNTYPFNYQSERCWYASRSVINICLTLILPAAGVVVATTMIYLKTWALARGARLLLLTADQYEHIYQCLTFIIKFLFLLIITLTLGICAAFASISEIWVTYHIVHSFLGLVTSLALACNCRLFDSFANFGHYISRKYRKMQYGACNVVSSTNLNVLVWQDEADVI